MTFYVDFPALIPCLHGYETLPLCEVPLEWRRLLIFDDTLIDALRGSSILTVRALMGRLPTWESLLSFLEDAADQSDKSIYVFSRFKCHYLEVCKRKELFLDTDVVVYPATHGFDVIGLKDKDILTCPSGRSLDGEVDIEQWLVARDKALEIEREIDGLSLRPLPLTLDELIGRLVDKLRLPSAQDSI